MTILTMRHLALLLLLVGAVSHADERAAVASTACNPLDEANHTALARNVLEEVLGQGRIDENEHIYHSEFRAHGLNRSADRDEDRAATQGWRSAFPDLRITVLRTVTQCDLVTVHYEGSGTNTGEGGGLPATGRTVRVHGMTIFRFKDGKVFEEWTAFDQYSLLKQLGLVQ